MKKVFLTLVAVATMGVANAQLFVGGNLGFGMNSGSYKSTETYAGETKTLESDAPKTIEWVVGPKIGFQADRLSFGVAFSIGGQKWNALNPSESDLEDAYYWFYGDLAKELGDREFTMKKTSWGVTPFVRYNAIEAGNFALFCELQIPINGIKTKVKSVYETTNGKETEEFDGPKTFSWGVEIVPGLSYNLNDHISFDVYLDLIRLGFTQTKVTLEEEGTSDGVSYKDTYEKKYNDFHVGVYSLPALVTVGFNYKF